MNYEELSDRELDALVAERLYWPTYDLRFSTKLDAAFKVVEAMRERGYSVQLHGGHLPATNQWFVEFTSKNDSWSYIGKSLPRAICIAALHALEVK